MLSVNKVSVIMLIVLMLNVVMLSVVAAVYIYVCMYGVMKNTYCLFQIKFITEYTNVQHIIITQI